MIERIVKDGYNSSIFEGARFCGKYEIPYLGNTDVLTPKDMIPFEKRHLIKDKKGVYIHFYMKDESFIQVIRHPEKYIDELNEFEGIITPDNSIYRNMMLGQQIMNTIYNRGIGFYYKKHGLKVIPNVRWGDKRTYEFCFEGLEKGAVYSISTYGCIRSKKDKEHFKNGLEEFIRRLKPKKILVHGAMPSIIFDDYKGLTEFVHYEDRLTRVHRKYNKLSQESEVA